MSPQWRPSEADQEENHQRSDRQAEEDQERCGGGDTGEKAAVETNWEEDKGEGEDDNEGHQGDQREDEGEDGGSYRS